MTSSPDSVSIARVAAPYTNSAARAIAAVEFLASDPLETFTLSEIARRCGLRKSTAKSVLDSLHQAGWLTRSPVDLRYGLGPMLILIGRAAEETRPEVNLARPILQALAVELQRECVLSAVSGSEMLVLDSTGPPGLRGRAVAPGQRGPLVPPYGAAFVAWATEASRADWYRRSGHTDPEWASDLEEILDATVRRGFVVTVQSNPRHRMARVMRAVSGTLTVGEMREILKGQLSQLPPDAYLLGTVSAGDTYVVDEIQAPIFDIRGSASYALTVHSIGLELGRSAIAKLGRRVRLAADRVTESIAAQRMGAWSQKR